MSLFQSQKFSFTAQLENADCGPACLVMVARHFGKDYSLREIRDVCGITKGGVTIRDLLVGGDHIGLTLTPVQSDLATLTQHAELPCILFWRSNHYVVLHRIEEKKGRKIFHVADPSFGKMRLAEEEFNRSWISSSSQGTALLVVRGPEWEKREPAVPDRPFAVKDVISFLSEYARKYRSGLSIVVFTLLLATSISWMLPILVQYLIDDGVLKSDFSVVYLVIIAQIALMLGQAAIQYIEGKILARLSMNISVDIVVGFLRKLIRLPLSYFDSRMYTDLLLRIEDQGRIESFISYQFIQVVFSTLTLFVMSGVLFYYSVAVFAVFWVLTLVSIFWITIFLKRRRRLDYARFSLQTNNSNVLYELITGMPEIKINSAENEKITAWELIQKKVYRLKIKALNLNHVQIVGSGTITQLKNILITLISALWVMSGDMSLGMMVSITYIIGTLTSPLLNISNFSRTAQDARLSFERLEEVQRRPDENTHCLAKMPEGIVPLRLDKVRFKYGRNDPQMVLNEVSLLIPAGKVTAIVGSSGSGKTTLMKLLLRFYLANDGKILLGEESLVDINADEWRLRCGVVMQDGFIYSDSVAGNVSMESVEVADAERVAFALRMACLDDFVAQLPQGDKTILGNAGVSLSGGQRQRILIARAIYRNPDYLFFDEATSLLDTITERRIMDNLSLFFKQKTVVVIAHRLSTVQRADQLIVLESGAVIESGTHQELVEKRGTYFDLVRNQLELVA